MRRVNRKRLEPALVDGALPDRLPAAVQFLRVGSGYPLHQAREPVRSHGPDNEVPVRRHQAVRDETHRMARESPVQHLQEPAIIPRILEERDLSCAAVDDMEITGFAGGAWTTWHREPPADSNRDA